MAQQAWPSSQFPLSHPHPESPPQGAGKSFRPWLSLGVGKKGFLGLHLQSGFINADEIRNKEHKEFSVCMCDQAGSWGGAGHMYDLSLQKKEIQA